MESKGLEDFVLDNLCKDIKKRLKEGFSKAIVTGDKKKVRNFIVEFNKRTHHYYSKRIEYAENQKGIGKDIYPVDINFYDLRAGGRF